ncbi:hypothetical protein EKH55_2310 [Sinorhizobium alkalisoli]|nr:hypothetical protein EKH55_2310 [Sinorhizobium alkalisoli]
MRRLFAPMGSALIFGPTRQGDAFSYNVRVLPDFRVNEF